MGTVIVFLAGAGVGYGFRTQIYVLQGKVQRAVKAALAAM